MLDYVCIIDRSVTITADTEIGNVLYSTRNRINLGTLVFVVNHNSLVLLLLPRLSVVPNLQ
jgi:hypothetical protein